MKFRKFSLKDALILASPAVVFLLTLSVYIFAEDSWLNPYWKKWSPRSEPWSPLTWTKGFHNESVRAQNILNALSAPVSSSLPVYELNIDQGDLGYLNDGLPKRDREVRGYLRFEGRTYRVKMKYRGDNPWHWSYSQKSMRVKLKKGSIIQGVREFDLINPKDISMLRNLLADHIAKDMGLMASRHYFVRVRLNNRDIGVYHYWDRIDESFIRFEKRMPGSLYYGENLRRGGWDDVAKWDKKASLSGDHKTDRTDLDLLLKTLKAPLSPEFPGKIESIVDVEKYLKLMALLNIAGSGHVDIHHNHKLYFDQSLGTFEPIPWDSFGFNNLFRLLNDAANPIMNRLLTIPAFVQRRNQILWEALNSFAGSKRLIRKIDTLAADVTPYVQNDITRDFVDYRSFPVHNRLFSMQEYRQAVIRLKHYIRLRNQYLASALGWADLSWSFDDGARKLISDDRLLAGTFTAAASGVSASKITQLSLAVEATGKNPNLLIELWQDRNRNSRYDSGDHLVTREMIRRSASQAVLFIDEVLYPGIALEARDAANVLDSGITAKEAPLAYTYFIVTSSPKAHLRVSHVEALNFTTGDAIAALPAAGAKDDLKASSLHPWDLPVPTAPKKIVWSGRIVLKTDLQLQPQDRLVIQPGTRIKIAPGVTIYSRGRVLALGTRNAPIFFERAVTGQPWGALCLFGEGASGSRFTYTRLSGGSLYAESNVRFTGMINVHHAKDVMFEHCEFTGNEISDDTVHVIHSEAAFRYCKFYDTHSDSLDMDYASGVLEYNFFTNSGNDSVDLMTSDPTIRNSIFEKAGDKGISVGEASNPVIYNNILRDNRIGIQTKDRSNPLIVNDVIIGSTEYGIHAYQKNWRYGGGGRGRVFNSVITGNAKGLAFDNRSHVTVAYSLIDFDLPAARKRDIRGEKDDSWPRSGEGNIRAGGLETAAHGSMQVIELARVPFEGSSVPMGLARDISHVRKEAGLQ